MLAASLVAPKSAKKRVIAEDVLNIPDTMAALEALGQITPCSSCAVDCKHHPAACHGLRGVLRPLVTRQRGCPSAHRQQIGLTALRVPAFLCVRYVKASTSQSNALFIVKQPNDGILEVRSACMLPRSQLSCLLESTSVC